MRVSQEGKSLGLPTSLQGLHSNLKKLNPYEIKDLKMSSSYWTLFIIYGDSYEDGKKWGDPYDYTSLIIPEKYLAGAGNGKSGGYNRYPESRR